jgi:hypothetical protein
LSVSVTGVRAALVSVRPSGRAAGFLGGQINVGAIATMIIKPMARMTRLSKVSPQGTGS